MARPRKFTLDFFIHDANARNDRKIKSLRRKHGNDGYAAYFCLLEMFCGEEGIRLDLSNSLDLENAVEECKLRDEAHFYQIVNTCVEVGLFDRQLWEGERLLFSPELHDRYVQRLEERKQTALRQQRKAEADNLQKRIDQVEASEGAIMTEFSEVMTRHNSQELLKTRDNDPDIRDQNSDTETDLIEPDRSELAKTASSIAPLDSQPEEKEKGRSKSSRPAKQDKPLSAEAQIRRTWYDTVFKPNYPYRLDETGFKERKLGTLEKKLDYYLSLLPIEMIESDEATQALRDMYAIGVAKYKKQYNTNECVYTTPRGSKKKVICLPYIVDPHRWFLNKVWENQPVPPQPGEVVSPNTRTLAQEIKKEFGVNPLDEKTCFLEVGAKILYTRSFDEFRQACIDRYPGCTQVDELLDILAANGWIYSIHGWDYDRFKFVPDRYLPKNYERPKVTHE